ncbi:MAG: hypothetical protein QF535_12465, partial [Anaerolineales bacterium]|nr:hypothetical protein [Anaerolineales bacterium]
ETTSCDPCESTEGDTGEGGSSGTDGQDFPPDTGEPSSGEGGEDGTPTYDGEPPAPEEEESTQEAEGNTVIDTGDAIATGDIDNSVSTNDVGTNGTSTPYFEEGDEMAATSTPPVEEETSTSTDPTSETTGGAGGSGANEDIDNNNSVDVANSAEVTGQTGSNQANNNDNTVIKTGDAYAQADILNVVNTNIYNSTGFFLFLSSLLNGTLGDLDARDLEFFNPDYYQLNDSCTDGCPGSTPATIDIANNSDTNIGNAVSVTAGTGANESLDNSGASQILTGNAYAAANVINVANTNIINSNYLLLTFNNFGDWGGDFILPVGSDFTHIFDGGTGITSGSYTNNNDAGVNNNLGAGANSGDNAAKGSDGSSVNTGNSSSAANVINHTNTNLFGGDTFRILFKVHGDWNGNIFGAPPGMTWKETTGGVELTYNPNQLGTSKTTGNVNIENNSTTTIDNNIEVFALTGENKVGGNTAAVSTGDAYAAANVNNFANTNVIGKNWLLAIVNIFGDWNGDISFGRPDLWIGGKAEIYDRAPGPYSHVTFNYTVHNFGDTPATDVKIRNVY